MLGAHPNLVSLTWGSPGCTRPVKKIHFLRRCAVLEVAELPPGMTGSSSWPSSVMLRRSQSSPLSVMEEAVVMVMEEAVVVMATESW